MSWEALVSVLGPSVVAAVVAWVVARGNNRTAEQVSKESTAGLLVEQLRERVSALEDKVAVLESKLTETKDKFRAAAGHIDALALWLYYGRSKMRPPIPDIIEDRLTHPDLWDQINWDEVPDRKE